MVPEANDSKVAAPAKYMPAMAVATVIPETRTARPGSGGRLESRPLTRAAGTLLPLSAQVEHRVVDADGEPDQRDHRRGLVERVWLSGPSRPIAENTAVAASSCRHEGGDEGAEREHEDYQRDRKR